VATGFESAKSDRPNLSPICPQAGLHPSLRAPDDRGMDATTSPIELIDQLDPDAIQARLAELRNQANALRVLLRAALRRRPRTQEVGHLKSEEIRSA
jgi:hypothetical protein